MYRLKRVSSLIKKELSRIIREDLYDCRIGFISITEVTLSKDLKKAWVHYSQIGSSEEKKMTRTRLYKARSFLKRQLGNAIDMRTVPDLHFKFDPSIERGVDIITKINKLSS